MAKISIIIPAYNAAKTILETIESVQQQTFKDWELIVINDGSTDETLSVLKTISDREGCSRLESISNHGVDEVIAGSVVSRQSTDDPRLQVYSYPNGGVCVARNRGIALAKGEYLAFLDADDLWLKDKLELQLKALEQNPQAGVAYSWTCFMDEQPDGYVYHSCPTYNFTGNVYPQLLEADFIHSGSNVLVRRQAIEAVGSFDPSCAGCEDWDMWVRLAAKWHFVVVPQQQVIYRRTLGSISSNVEQMYRQAVFAVNKAYQAAPSQWQYLKSKTTANLHMYTASLYLQHGIETRRIQQAGKHLGMAIAQNWQILGNSTMQKLLIKFWLYRIFPPQLSRNIFQWLRKLIAINDPRVKFRSNRS
ncbi:MAG TPA: glycosyltransferase family 2 protein [Xenococcaceae cyanobacterium]|jgi:glycosyltransferase involved in cell wall biosynthesis